MTPTEIVTLATQFISSVGFPIFVAVWMLLRSDKLQQQTNDTLIKLTEVIDKCARGGTPL